MRPLLLFSLVLFSAYAQQQAGKEIRNMRSSEMHQLQSGAGMMIGDMEFIRRAIQLSRKTYGDYHGRLFGCVVVKDDKIVGEGWNKIETSSHVEVQAIGEACRSISLSTLKGSVLYTSAKPCSSCLSFIHQAGIKKVYYSTPGNSLNELDSAMLTFNSIGISETEGQTQPLVGAQDMEPITEQITPFRSP